MTQLEELREQLKVIRGIVWGALLLGNLSNPEVRRKLIANLQRELDELRAITESLDGDNGE